MGLQVGFYWLGRWCNEIDLAVKSVAGFTNGPEFERVCLVTVRGSGQTESLPRRTTRYPYSTVNELQDVFHHADEAGLEYAVISFGNGVPSSAALLAKLLKSEPVRKAVWSFRIAPITGAGLRHPPRLPLVDSHFVVLNLGRARESGFFERKLVHGSHFAAAGGRHAHLASMIEYSVAESELNDHFAPEESTDQFGKVCRYDPMPFHLCRETGFITCYPEFDSALRSLLEANLSGDRAPRARSIRARFVREGEFYYRRRPLDLDAATNWAKRRLDLNRFVFKKRYEGEI